MPDLTISERAAVMLALLGPFAPTASRRPAPLNRVIELAGLVRDLAQSVEQRDAEVLAAHQGPYFNGVDMRCKCQQIVTDGDDWARHVARARARADR